MKVVNQMAAAHEREELGPNSTVRLRLGTDKAILLDVTKGTSSGGFLADLPGRLVKQFTSSV